MGARVYCLAAYRAHPPRRRPRGPALPTAAPTAAERDFYDLRARVVGLESRDRDKDATIARLGRELAELAGERNPLPASWGGPLSDEDIDDLNRLARAEDERQRAGKGG